VPTSSIFAETKEDVARQANASNRASLLIKLLLLLTVDSILCVYTSLCVCVCGYTSVCLSVCVNDCE
jgi:hypothetical protein